MAAPMVSMRDVRVMITLLPSIRLRCQAEPSTFWHLVDATKYKTIHDLCLGLGRLIESSNDTCILWPTEAEEHRVRDEQLPHTHCTQSSTSTNRSLPLTLESQPLRLNLFLHDALLLPSESIAILRDDDRLVVRIQDPPCGVGISGLPLASTENASCMGQRGELLEVLQDTFGENVKHKKRKKKHKKSRDSVSQERGSGVDELQPGGKHSCDNGGILSHDFEKGVKEKRKKKKQNKEKLSSPLKYTAMDSSGIMDMSGDEPNRIPNVVDASVDIVQHALKEVDCEKARFGTVPMSDGNEVEKSPMTPNTSSLPTIDPVEALDEQEGDQAEDSLDVGRKKRKRTRRRKRKNGDAIQPTESPSLQPKRSRQNIAPLRHNSFQYRYSDANNHNGRDIKHVHFNSPDEDEDEIMLSNTSMEATAKHSVEDRHITAKNTLHTCDKQPVESNAKCDISEVGDRQITAKNVLNTFDRQPSESNSKYAVSENVEQTLNMLSKASMPVETMEQFNFKSPITVLDHPNKTESASTDTFQKWGKHNKPVQANRRTPPQNSRKKQCGKKTADPRFANMQVFSRNMFKKSTFYPLGKEDQLNDDQANASTILKNVGGTTLENTSAISTLKTPATPVPVEPAPNEARDYSKDPLLHGPPRTGDTIAYKLLEMTENYCPEVSSYREAKVLSFDGKLQSLEVKVLKGAKKKVSLGKFDLQLEDDEGILTNMPTDPEEKVTLCWTALIEPRLLNSG